MISAVETEDYSLIPGLTERAPEVDVWAPSKQPRRTWWVVLGVVVGGVALLTVIALVAVGRNHHEAAPITLFTPTGASHPAAGAPGSPGTRAGPSRASANRQLGRAQASAIDRYLSQSGQARQGVGSAISAISSCTNVSSAVSALQYAAEVRSRIFGALASSEVSALPNGAAVVSHLREAMQASAAADLHYAEWGRAVAGCHGHAPHNGDFSAAQHFDALATPAKQQFATAWNPIAATYGLPKQDAGTF